MLLLERCRGALGLLQLGSELRERLFGLGTAGFGLSHASGELLGPGAQRISFLLDLSGPRVRVRELGLQL